MAKIKFPAPNADSNAFANRATWRVVWWFANDPNAIGSITAFLRPIDAEPRDVVVAKLIDWLPRYVNTHNPLRDDGTLYGMILRESLMSVDYGEVASALYNRFHRNMG